MWKFQSIRKGRVFAEIAHQINTPPMPVQRTLRQEIPHHHTCQSLTSSPT